MSVNLPSEGERIKHLEFIQAVIARIGNNSFAIRGWAVTVTGALLVVSIQTENWRVAVVTLCMAMAFWVLDGSYVRRERMFRLLYDDVAQGHSPQVPTFSMSVEGYAPSVNLAGVLFSGTILMVHLPLMFIDATIAVLLFE
ncbi:hypothetical protein NJO91_31420 [Streptomyces microflavus]|uniref:hypothetical protein n=1 Tax=Streptomyces microflavus TaxID=1919 RepID=UPI0029AC7FDB|nr:hypothetical protein [Streptomyces microflavus]MDX2407625.1 hypothetical protein [Streptomyces microflavus]